MVEKEDDDEEEEGPVNSPLFLKGPFRLGFPPSNPDFSAATMSSDFEGYEQDFSVLTAEITNRIGKVPKLLGGERWRLRRVRLPAAAPLGLPSAGDHDCSRV